MKKLLIIAVLLLAVAGVSQAEYQYGSRVQLTQERLDLANNSTFYALSVTTKTVGTVQSRDGRITDGRSYVINLSTLPVWITTIDYSTCTYIGGNCTPIEAIRTQGHIIYGTDQQVDGFDRPATVRDANKYYLRTNKAYYILGGDDEASLGDVTQSIRVEDAWTIENE
jgi:hypothetical protein